MSKTSNTEIIKVMYRGLADKPLDITIQQEVSINDLAIDVDSNSIVLRKIPANRKSLEYIKYRSDADTQAIKQKYHNPSLHNDLIAEQTDGLPLFQFLEDIRPKLIAAKNYLGMLADINKIAEVDYKKDSSKFSKQLFENNLFLATEMAMLSKNNTFKLKKRASSLINFWQKKTKGNFFKFVDLLDVNLEDQSEYAKNISLLIDYLTKNKIIADRDINKSDPSQDDEELDHQPDESNNNMSPEEDKDETTGESNSDDVSASEDGLEGKDSDEQHVKEGQSSKPWWHDDNERKVEKEYKIYTKEFDEVIFAEDLLDSKQELAELRKNLDKYLRNSQALISRMTSKMQKLVLSLQKVSWQTNQEEGILDQSKLTRIITSRNDSLAFKVEKNSSMKNTVVTLLVDNSGSMRGRPIIMSAICADIIASCLERCQIKTEILGFTTKNWKGGSAKKKWLNSSNKTPQPGRLNDLRHIIYKQADNLYFRSKKSISIMIKDSILKENIDGEALTWAYSRIKRRFEKKKVIIVISDGAPVDDATLSFMGARYLDMHLKKVIFEIDKDPEIHLSAIGIGHDVSKYYKNAIMIEDVDQLGESLTNELTKLFKSEVA